MTTPISPFPGSTISPATTRSDDALTNSTEAKTQPAAEPGDSYQAVYAQGLRPNDSRLAKATRIAIRAMLFAAAGAGAVALVAAQALLGYKPEDHEFPG